jgi:acetolactate synthase-1/2/3 large subunit
MELADMPKDSVVDRIRVKTGGELVVDAMLYHGIDTVFCVPGDSHLPILDALHDVGDRISLITCRHEHGAAHMAEAYAKLTGRPGVCLVTRAPGACNAAIGVHTAFNDSTPMLLLVGQVETRFLGRESLQEADFVRLFAPIAKHAEQVGRTTDLSSAMERAFHIAQSNRTGPVVLSLPKDVLCNQTIACAPRFLPTACDPPPPINLREVRRLLAEAEKPLMIVGGSGWTDQARRDIVVFAESNDIPTCCAFRRHDVFDNRHSNFIGEICQGASSALIKRIKSADLLIAVGTRMGQMTTLGYTLVDPDDYRQRFVHVYPDKRGVGHSFKPYLEILADVAAFSSAARALAPVDSTHRSWWSSGARKDYVSHRTVSAGWVGAVDLAAIMACLDARLPDDAVVAIDAGNLCGWFSDWSQRYLSFGGGRRLLAATHGPMGYGVAAAIAAKLAMPERVVLGMAGDGGFAMTGQELATAMHYGLAPILMVLTNNMYGTIRLQQERTHPTKVVGTGLTNPNFAQLANAYGALGKTVERTEDFLPAFDEALGTRRAALIEIKVDPNVVGTRETLAMVR